MIYANGFWFEPQTGTMYTPDDEQLTEYKFQYVPGYNPAQYLTRGSANDIADKLRGALPNAKISVTYNTLAGPFANGIRMYTILVENGSYSFETNAGLFALSIYRYGFTAALRLLKEEAGPMIFPK